jgi:hypothetical protein
VANTPLLGTSLRASGEWGCVYRRLSPARNAPENKRLDRTARRRANSPRAAGQPQPHSVAKMMKTKLNSMMMTLMTLVVTLALAGCDQGSVDLDASKTDKVMLIYPSGDTIVTNLQMIGNLVEAMKCAKADNTLYDTAMPLKIEFFAGDTNLATFSAGGSLFRHGKTQYHDRTGKFRQAMGKLTERSKTPNQAPEDTARKLADPQR